MNSYSQLNQDNIVLNFLNNKRDGFFVDIGANDGKDLSNTYLLEKDYNWSGICVEPLLKEFNECKELRKKSICKNICIYDKNGEIEFSSIKGEYNMYSGISKDINHHKNITKNYGKNIILKCITFTKLLDDCKAPNLMDFLSLDTEGSELKILQSLNHDKYKFRYITLEHNNIEPNRLLIKDLLESKGYLFNGENHWDDTYILI
tara:strand:+ start:48 stop:659 length:612 start_codon:yes stop_codon:yes gene_type:complete